MTVLRNYSVVAGGQGDFKRSGAGSNYWGIIQRRIGEQLRASGWLAGKSDADKQLIHDTFAIWAMIPTLIWNQVGDEKGRDIGVVKGKALLRMLGIDYGSFDLAAAVKGGSFKIPFDRVYADLSKRTTLE